MKNIGILAIASLVALVLGVSSFATPTAHADVEGSVAIGCEFLAGAIDGDITDEDVTSTADFLAACDGISSTGDNLQTGATVVPPEPALVETLGEAETLADTLGDEDGELEVADFEDVDLDGNQIRAFGNTGITTSLYIFAFVDDAGDVTFDAEAGLSVAPFADEVCGVGDGDTDCDAASAPATRDGVVVATVTAAAGADEEDELDVTIIQEGDDDTSETILVTGPGNEVNLTLVEDVVQASATSAVFGDCTDENELDVTDSAALSNPNSTVGIAVVTDNDDVVLTRVAVGFDTDDDDIADIGETTGVSVDGGTSGTAAFAVICGGTDLGEAEITASINIGGTNEDESTATVTVVGGPQTVALTVAPAIIACDGTQTSTVTATVTDSEGNNVADGTDVEFSVVALGTANPITVNTVDGVASSTITPLSGATAGVTVVVTAGDDDDSAQSSVRVDCALPIPPTPGGPVATPTRTGTIGGPDTGSGGYIGQDSSAGFPTWTLVALALGSIALVGGGLVTRRVSK